MAEQGGEGEHKQKASNELAKNIMAEHAKDMSEIEALGNSPKIEDRLHSLDIFQQKFPKLPFGRTVRYLEKIRSDSENEVKVRAEEVYESTVRPYEKNIMGPAIKTMETINQILKPQVEIINNLASSFESTRKFAEELDKSMKVPVFELAKMDKITSLMEGIKLPPSFGKLEGVKFPTSLGFSLGTVPNLAISPLTLGNQYASIIRENEEEERTLPELLGVPEEDVRQDLNSIQNNVSDFFFNYEAYKFLYDLERTLRDIIYQRIIVPNGSNIANVVDLTIVTECQSKQKAEMDNRLVKASDRWIDYCDFTHLEMILRRGRNKERLKEIVNQQQFEAVVAKLNELDPIRKKIAHSRPLTIDEFTKIRLYGKEIITLFSP